MPLTHPHNINPTFAVCRLNLEKQCASRQGMAIDWTGWKFVTKDVSCG